MAFTYDFTSAPQISYVRLLIADTDPSCPIFQDDEITAAYAIQGNVWQSSQFYSGSDGAFYPSSPVSYRRVAALLLDALASNKARLSSVTQLLDVKLDPSKAATALREIAQGYRDEDDNGAFAIIEQVNNDWALRDRWWKQIARQSGGIT